MNLPKIVCPHEPSLLQALTGHTLAVRAEDMASVRTAADNVRNSGNHLFCVIFDSMGPLDELELGDELRDIPLAIMAASLGKFRRLARQVNRLRNLNIRIYLPCSDPENIVSLRILSSLGLCGCADFRHGKQDWDALADLMTYGVLERTPHAPIEPFAYIASHYDPLETIDWQGVYFEGPGRFLHTDKKGRVALSHAELQNNAFIAQNISEISSQNEFPPIEQRQEAWREYFTDNHPCASCDGWKLCLGAFSAGLPENNGCRAFFSEMTEVLRQYKSQKAQFEENRVWQP